MKKTASRCFDEKVLDAAATCTSCGSQNVSRCLPSESDNCDMVCRCQECGKIWTVELKHDENGFCAVLRTTHDPFGEARAP